MKTKIYSDKKDQDKESKTASEKPVSLSPRSLKEALDGLLRVKKEDDKNGTNEDETNQFIRGLE